MTDRVVPLWNVEKKTTSSNTDEFLIVEEEEIKKIGINDLINNNSNITEMENNIETNRSNIEKQSALIVGNQIGIEKNNRDIETINNNINTINSDIETINNKTNKIESFNNINILKESKVFATSVWTNSDQDSCILSDDTFAGLTYYKCTKNYTSFSQNVTLNANTKYTLSFWAYSSKEGASLRAYNSNLEGNNPTGQQIYVDIPNVGTQWKRYTVVFDIKDTYTACIRIEPTDLQDGGSDYVLIAGMTLMEGECVDFGWIGNPSDQNWKFLSKGTDIATQPGGKYRGTSLLNAPKTGSAIEFYYIVNRIDNDNCKITAFNKYYNIEYVATKSDGTQKDWELKYRNDDIYNFGLSSIASTSTQSCNSLYCKSIDLNFMCSGLVATSNANVSCYVGYTHDNGTGSTDFGFTAPFNESGNKKPLDIHVRLIRLNNNTWMFKINGYRANGYFSNCKYITGQNIEIKSFSFSSNDVNKKFETPCCIVKYNK